MRHREIDSGEAESLYRINRNRQTLRKLLLLFCRKFSEHIIHLLSRSEILSHTKTQACVLLCAQFQSNVLEAVVACIRTSPAQTYGSKRESYVIHDHNQILQRELLLVHPVSNRHTTQIHKRGRLQKQTLAILYIKLSHVAISA